MEPHTPLRKFVLCM